MRIALVVHCYYPDYFYGTEAYTRLIAGELAALGHEPTVIAATFAGDAPQAEPIERYVFDGVPVVRIDKNASPHTRLRHTYDQPEMIPTYRELLCELAPDAVHVCHLINHTTAVLRAAAELAIPAFATFTDFYGFCFNSKLQSASGGLCEGPSRSRSNCIACLLHQAPPAELPLERLARSRFVSPWTARALAAFPGLAGAYAADIRDLIARPRRLREAYGPYRAAIAPTAFLKEAYRANGFGAPLSISHFGIDIDRSPKPARSDGKIRLAYIGQLAPHKGVHLLLQALRRVAPGRLSLDIWGSEAQNPECSRDLRTLAQGLPVRFRGTFASVDTAEVLRDADMLAIPSTWHENSPLILLQALATHTPVIVSDVAGMAEFVRDGENGFVFRRSDAESLAQVLRGLEADPGLAARMSRSAHYERTPRDMVLDMLTLYSECGVGSGEAGETPPCRSEGRAVI